MDKINKNIGNKIRLLRKEKNLSQEELASMLDITRPILSNIENSERKINVEEIKKISKIFNISSDVLLGLQKPPTVTIIKRKSSKEQIRINVPQQRLGKFKQVLLYILNEVGSKPNIGETVIYKLLYFIDFDFYELFEEQLIGATYIKNNYGPTPVEFNKIIEDMIENEEVVRVTSKFFKYPQRKYLPLIQPDLSQLKANELQVINSVLDRLSDMNAYQISDYSHQDIPWIYTEDMQPIEYEAVFYRIPPYSVRKYEDEV
ncbi:MAG: repressor protein [Desulfuromonas sp. SDB]|nr:MAG: repressor protein [Desulfuromonas sp. SDB]